MSTQYSLTVVNNSTEAQDLCVYQKPVDLGVQNAVSLAWLSAPCWPNQGVTFKWSLEYSFVWSQTGSLKPGVVFAPQQSLPADPSLMSANQTQFASTEGTFAFQPGAAAGSPQLGSLYIRQLSSIPPSTAAVGIGMSNAGVFVVQAEPNQNLVFTPHPEYWITAGHFAAGQVLDLEQISNEAMVAFNGTFEMTATLGPDNTWSVTGV